MVGKPRRLRFGFLVVRCQRRDLQRHMHVRAPTDVRVALAESQRDNQTDEMGKGGGIGGVIPSPIPFTFKKKTVICHLSLVGFRHGCFLSMDVIFFRHGKHGLTRIFLRAAKL